MQRPGLCLTLCSLLFGATAANADTAPCEQWISAGKEVRVPFPGYYGYLRIYLPKAPPPSGQYPVIVHYHGYGSRLRPHVKIARAITADRYFLSVGMDYGSRSFYEDLVHRRLPDEVARLHKVLDRLAECVPIDRDGIYLSGYSQGAFAVSLIGERAIDVVDGLIFLGGGRSEGEDNLPPEDAMEGLPVFVGYGGDDHKYGGVAEGTATAYALLGAEVSKEVWPGMDHFEGSAWYLKDRSHVVNINNWLLDNTFHDER